MCFRIAWRGAAPIGVNVGHAVGLGLMNAQQTPFTRIGPEPASFRFGDFSPMWIASGLLTTREVSTLQSQPTFP
jgi:hypothetical protein